MFQRITNGHTKSKKTNIKAHLPQIPIVKKQHKQLVKIKEEAHSSQAVSTVVPLVTFFITWSP